MVYAFSKPNAGKSNSPNQFFIKQSCNMLHTCIYKPRQSDELRQYPYDVNIPLGQKHPSVHPPTHCSFSFASHVWGHSGPHC